VIAGPSRRMRWVALLLGVSLLGCVRAVPGERLANPGTPLGDRGMGIRLVDVAEQAGVTARNITGEQTKNYILEVNGNGAAFFDYDNDGYMDVLIVNGSTLQNFEHGGDQMVILYRNERNGTFTEVTAKARLLKKGWGMGVCVADYDNDGFQDVYITAFGPNVLYRNNGDGTFTDVTQRAGVGDPRWSTGCAFGDYDRDGHVDLYVANFLTFDVKKPPGRGPGSRCENRGLDVLMMCGPRGSTGEPDTLYRNNGDGTFTDVTRQSGIRDPGTYGFGVIFSDLDNDGWPDIFIATDSTPNLQFRNNRDGTFSEVGLFAGTALSERGIEQGCMGADVADYNNDGHFDIFVTNFSDDYNTLYRSNGDGTYSDVSYPTGLGESSLPYVGWGTGFVDFDNDGLLDIFVANGHVDPEVDRLDSGTKYLQRKQLYWNLGNGNFREITEEIGGGLLIEKSSRGAAFGDFDNDGDIDVLVINLNDRPTLLRNEGGNRNRWIALTLVGTKSNRDAIGARVIAKVGNLTQTAEVRSGGSYLSHNDMRIHFGLGDASRVDRLEVRWPSGAIETFEQVQGNRFWRIIEGKGIAAIR
jgi:hypothetical protein